MEELNIELNLIEFLDKHKIGYRLENGKVICGGVYLSNKRISTLPKDIGSLECNILYLANNNIKELPISIGDIHCRGIYLQNNDIPQNSLKYLERIENLKNVSTDYGNDLVWIKQLCVINSRQDKIKSLLI
jgi:hypothetical protein